MVTDVYKIMLAFHPTRTYPVVGGDNDRMKFANVNGGDSGGAPDTYNGGANMGKHKVKRKK